MQGDVNHARIALVSTDRIAVSKLHMSLKNEQTCAVEVLPPVSHKVEVAFHLGKVASERISGNARLVVLGPDGNAVQLVGAVFALGTVRQLVPVADGGRRDALIADGTALEVEPESRVPMAQR